MLRLAEQEQLSRLQASGGPALGLVSCPGDLSDYRAGESTIFDEEVFRQFWGIRAAHSPWQQNYRGDS